jgi:hypothetical protein
VFEPGPDEIIRDGEEFCVNDPKNGSYNHTLHSRIALVNAGCRQMNTVKALKQGLVENQGLTL